MSKYTFISQFLKNKKKLLKLFLFRDTYVKTCQLLSIKNITYLWGLSVITILFCDIRLHIRCFFSSGILCRILCSFPVYFSLPERGYTTSFRQQDLQDYMQQGITGLSHSSPGQIPKPFPEGKVPEQWTNTETFMK